MATNGQAGQALVPVTLLSGQLLGEILLSEGDRVQEAKHLASKLYTSGLVVPTLRLVFQGRELMGDEEVSELGLLEPGEGLTALLSAPQKVLSASADGSAKLFDFESGRCEETFEVGAEKSSINSVSVSDDGQYFLLATEASLCLFSTLTGSCFQRLAFEEFQGLQHAALSHDAQLILVVSSGAVYVVTRVTGDLRCLTEPAHCRGDLFASFSPDASQIVVASKDCTAQVYDVASGRCEQVFSGHFGWVLTARFCPKGLRVLTACADGVTRLFDLTGRCQGDFRRHGGSVRSSCFSPDGEKILAAVNDCTAKLFNLKSGRCERTFNGHTGILWSALFSFDGVHVLTASADCTARIFLTDTGECLRIFSGHEDMVLSVAFLTVSSFATVQSDGSTGSHLERQKAKQAENEADVPKASEPAPAVAVAVPPSATVALPGVPDEPARVASRWQPLFRDPSFGGSIEAQARNRKEKPMMHQRSFVFEDEAEHLLGVERQKSDKRQRSKDSAVAPSGRLREVWKIVVQQDEGSEVDPGSPTSPSSPCLSEGSVGSPRSIWDLARKFSRYSVNSAFSNVSSVSNGRRSSHPSRRASEESVKRGASVAGSCTSEESTKKKPSWPSEESIKKKSPFPSEESIKKKSPFPSEESIKKKSPFPSEESIKKKSPFPSEESTKKKSSWPSEESCGRKTSKRASSSSGLSSHRTSQVSEDEAGLFDSEETTWERKISGAGAPRSRGQMLRVDMSPMSPKVRTPRSPKSPKSPKSPPKSPKSPGASFASLALTIGMSQMSLKPLQLELEAEKTLAVKDLPLARVEEEEGKGSFCTDPRGTRSFEKTEVGAKTDDLLE